MFMRKAPRVPQKIILQEDMLGFIDPPYGDNELEVPAPDYINIFLKGIS